MDNIEKWLKSLRLHKYTHLFKAMSYDDMLALEEKYLIDKEVTKGARNKMLISIKKLNLRRERLINMIDDLNQDNISMKEALTVLKDMLVTPIPPPPAATPTSGSTSTTNAAITQPAAIQPPPRNSNNHHLSPYELTHLFIETLEKVAHRMIELAGMEDNACHGIMAAIVDECLKHNSFTKEQKVKVASFRQHFSREQKAKLANNFRTRPHNYHHHYQQQQHQQQQQQHQQHQPPQSQLPSPLLASHQTQPHNHQHHLNLQHYHQQHNHHHHPLNPLNHQFQQQSFPPTQEHQVYPLSIQQTQQQQKRDQHQNQFHHYHYGHLPSARIEGGGGGGGGPIQPPSLSASLSTIGSTASNSADEEEQQQQQHQQLQRQQPLPPPRQTYKEYSLLEPGMTFELPCLRALAAAEKLNRRQLCFLSVFQS